MMSYFIFIYFVESKIYIYLVLIPHLLLLFPLPLSSISLFNNEKSNSFQFEMNRSFGNNISMYAENGIIWDKKI